uniref:Uncharacterized protein n=1 Tax=Ciona intestinalis TaxID=7719 RepID=F6QMC1_CIOIN
MNRKLLIVLLIALICFADQGESWRRRRRRRGRNYNERALNENDERVSGENAINDISAKNDMSKM